MSKQQESTTDPQMLRTAYSDSGHSLTVDIARKIQIGRRDCGMTQRDLAKKMGVSPSAVAQWETSLTKPTILNRVDLARVLAIPFAELLPESELGEQQINISDPQLLALVTHYLKLSPRLREAHLMLVVAATDDSDHPPAANPPGPR